MARTSSAAWVMALVAVAGCRDDASSSEPLTGGPVVVPGGFDSGLGTPNARVCAQSECAGQGIPDLACPGASVVTSCQFTQGACTLSVLCGVPLADAGREPDGAANDGSAPHSDAEVDADVTRAGQAEGETCGGIAGFACAEGLYCDYAKGTGCEGVADASGLCTVRGPDACFFVYQPVCGCDHRTYSNACVAASQGAAVMREGACTDDDCASAGGHVVQNAGAQTFDCPQGEVAFQLAGEQRHCCAP